MIKFILKTIAVVIIGSVLLVHGCVGLYGLAYENLSDHRDKPIAKRIEV